MEEKHLKDPNQVQLRSRDQTLSSLKIVDVLSLCAPSVKSGRIAKCCWHGAPLKRRSSISDERVDYIK